MANKEFILIRTGLKGAIAKEILDSVLGQLSDGKWENSPAAEHYWRFADIEMVGNEACIKVQTREYFRWNVGSRPGSAYFTDNYFVTKMGLDEKTIKEFFARKIKEVAKDELKDAGGPEAKWDRNNHMETHYLSYDQTITFSHVYFVYEWLKGRNCVQKYDPDVADAMIA